MSPAKSPNISGFLLPKGKQTRMKAKWGLFMTEQKKNTIITSGIAVLAVILAYCLRIVGRGSFYPMLFSYLRSFIYIGLFAAWGLSVRQRIVQKQVCRFMTVTAVLLIIWMVVRSAKYFIFWQPDASVTCGICSICPCCLCLCWRC